MVSNQEIIESNQNKNLSPRLKELIEEANIHAKSAETKILEAYNHAVDIDGLTPKKAAKVLKENLTYSPQWITKFLPQEAKQQHAQKLKPLSTSSQTKQIDTKNPVIPQPEPIIQDAEIEKEDNTTIFKRELGIKDDEDEYDDEEEQLPIADYRKNKEEYQQSELLQKFRDEKKLPTKTEDEQQTNQIILPRDKALKFANELKLDILTLLPKNGSIEFTITKEKLDYRLI